MNKIIILFSFIIITNIGVSQTQNWSEHIAPIFYENCTSCHNQSGICPFPLITYQDAELYGPWISSVVSSGKMPPWPPDTSYQRFAHERYLTQIEKDAIVNWVNNGMPEGDQSLAPNPPVYSTDGILGTPDLYLTMPEYTSKASASDDYSCFVLPTGITTDKYIKAIEVVPGNYQIVHHVLVYIDTTGTFQTDSSGYCGGPSDARLLGGYVPGGSPIIYPDNQSNFRTGVRLPANSTIVLAMHYPDGSLGMKDSSSVKIFFYPDSVSNIREVYALPVLSDWDFCILPDSIKTLTKRYPEAPGILPQDVSVMSIMPHMHILGRSIGSYAVTFLNDTIPFIQINDWDFNWQDFYYFKNLVKVPFGSAVYGHATYDNTSANPFNPNNPPDTVCAGEATTDEMFLFYFHFMGYEPGDELINIDSLISMNTSITDTILTPQTNHFYVTSLSADPNPFSNVSKINYSLVNTGATKLTIHNQNGQLIKTLVDEIQEKGKHVKYWDGTSINGKTSSGLYFYRLESKGYVKINKLIYLK